VDALVARVEKQLQDPWMRIRCLPRCRSDEPMNHGACDCGAEQFITDLRALLAALREARADGERLDWLQRSGLFDGVPSDALYAVPTLDGLGNLGEGNDLRTAIDAARAAGDPK
jgi:hypothetical protein